MAIKREEYATIRAEASARGITRLVHFTQSRKLAHILFDASGIKCSTDLEKHNGDVFDPNDVQRLDHKLTHISCSVQYPNQWNLRRMKEREKFFQDWSVLLLDPSPLWEAATLFSPRNAAAMGGALLKEGLEGFRAMYASSINGAYGRVYSRTAKMLACAPTDDQAEVMVYKSVPLNRIVGVMVHTDEQAALEIARLRQIGSIPKLKWIVAPDIFSQRVGDLLRNGTPPTEREYAKAATSGSLK